MREPPQTEDGSNIQMIMNMKRYIAFIFAAVLALPLAFSCKKDSAPDIAPGATGQWHLTSWNGKAPKGFDIWMELLPDGTCTIWQQTVTSTYVRLDGTFSVSGNVLSGVYSDGIPWICDYEYSLPETGSQLVLVSLNGESVTSVYSREEVPESVRTPLFTKASDDESGTFRFL